MILARNEILRRLNAGDIFKKNTWREDCLREASYVLRIADDALLIDGKFYDAGKRYDGDYIRIDPGKIAILSTMEWLHMPADLVGKIGIRLNYANQGLTGLMGIQVDPLYGRDQPSERLFIRVANFGNEAIRLSPGDEVFTFELHELSGKFECRKRESTWKRMKGELSHQTNASWSYVTRVQANLTSETSRLRDYLQPLVMFGVFLVAVSILSVALAVMFRAGGQEDVVETSWLTLDERTLLLCVLLIGILGTAFVGVMAGWRFFRPYRIGDQRPTNGWIRRHWKKFWNAVW